MISCASELKRTPGLDLFKIHNICRSASEAACPYHLERSYTDVKRMNTFLFSPSHREIAVLKLQQNVKEKKYTR